MQGGVPPTSGAPNAAPPKHASPWRTGLGPTSCIKEFVKSASNDIHHFTIDSTIAEILLTPSAPLRECSELAIEDPRDAAFRARTRAPQLLARAFQRVHEGPRVQRIGSFPATSFELRRRRPCAPSSLLTFGAELEPLAAEKAQPSLAARIVVSVFREQQRRKRDEKVLKAPRMRIFGGCTRSGRNFGLPGRAVLRPLVVPLATFAVATHYVRNTSIPAVQDYATVAQVAIVPVRRPRALARLPMFGYRGADAGGACGIWLCGGRRLT